MTDFQWKAGALFYGCGALDLAVANTWGAELSWYAENDSNVRRVGLWHHEHIPNLGDVTRIRWADLEPVDILTAGTPCQDLSLAGKMAGMTEGTRSNLWVVMREAIAALRPRLVVWENVRGAATVSAASEVEHCPGCVGSRRAVTLRALGRVVGDLSDLGYDARWLPASAAEVGAPHLRPRIFLLAHPRGTAPPDPIDPRSDHRGLGQAGRTDSHYRVRQGQLLPTPTVLDRGDKMDPDEWSEFCIEYDRRYGNSNGHGPSLNVEAQKIGRGNWGKYTPAVMRWERLTRAAPEPLWHNEQKGEDQVSPVFVEWMMGFPHGWVTKVPGMMRKPSLRAMGNAVVPQQAERAFRRLSALGS